MQEVGGQKGNVGFQNRHFFRNKKKGKGVQVFPKKGMAESCTKKKNSRDKVTGTRLAKHHPRTGQSNEMEKSKTGRNGKRLKERTSHLEKFQSQERNHSTARKGGVK